MAQQLRLSIIAREPSVAKRGSFSYLREPEYAKFTAPTKTIEFSNGYGGFTDKGKAYQLLVGPDKVPPSPWSNVVANPRFGFLVTESGGGYTWASNSRENRLTPWSNDPVSDPLGEALYLRDVASGAYWSATPKPVRSKENYCVTHGIGFTEFTTQQKGIFSSHTSSFFRPITLAMNLKKEFVCLENLLFLPPAEQLKQLLKFYSSVFSTSQCPAPASSKSSRSRQN